MGGDLDDAINAYRQGLEIERFTLGSFHQNSIVTIMNIGKIQRDRQDYYAAINSYKQALEIQRHRHQNCHEEEEDYEDSLSSPLEISNTLSTIAEMYFQLQDYRESLSAYQEALQIRRKMHNHLDVASSLNSIGLVFHKLQLYSNALQSFEESHHIRKQLLGPNHSDVAKVLYNVAAVLFDTGNDDDALTHYREALQIQTIEASNDDILLTLQSIAHLYQQQGEYDDALSYFKESLWRQQKVFKNQDKNQEEKYNNYATGIAQTLSHIGNLHLRKGDTKLMMNAFSQAARYLQVCNSSRIECQNEFIIRGLTFYNISKICPECSPVA